MVGPWPEEFPRPVGTVNAGSAPAEALLGQSCCRPGPGSRVRSPVMPGGTGALGLARLTLWLRTHTFRSHISVIVPLSSQCPDFGDLTTSCLINHFILGRGFPSAPLVFLVQNCVTCEDERLYVLLALCGHKPGRPASAPRR